MTTLVGRRDRERHVLLLAGLDCDIERAAIAGHCIAGAIRVDGKAGIDQIPVGLEQPLDARCVAASLLVGGEGRDDVAVGGETLVLQPDQGHQDGGILALHVNGAAPVIISVLFDQLERIGGPIGPFSLNHIQMADIKHRLRLAVALQADDDVSFGRVIGRRQEMDVAPAETSREQPSLDLVRRFGRAFGVDRVGLDQLLQDVMAKVGPGVGGSSRRHGPRHCEERQRRSNPGQPAPTPGLLRCARDDGEGVELHHLHSARLKSFIRR